MCEIYSMADGTFRCVGKIQDGTERWTCNTLEEAVKSMKRFAKVMNGTKIKKKHIAFFVPKHVAKTEWVEQEL